MALNDYKVEIMGLLRTGRKYLLLSKKLFIYTKLKKCINDVKGRALFVCHRHIFCLQNLIKVGWQVSKNSIEHLYNIYWIIVVEDT